MEINSGNKNFSRKRVILFLETQDNPFYYQYVYAISKEISDSHGLLEIVTLQEPFERRQFKSLPRYFRRRNTLKHLEMDLLSAFPSVSVRCESSRPSKIVRHKSKHALRALIYTNQLTSVFPEHKYLAPSLHSLSTSAFTMSSDPLAKISKYKKLLGRACSMYITYFYIAGNAILEFKPDLLIFLNGRTPEQAVFKEVAENLNLPCLFLEHGAKPGKTYFLEEFQTQDRLKTQQLIQTCSNNLSSKELDQILSESDTWIQRQMYDRTQNPALSLRDLKATNVLGEEEIFPIFTSSIDEEMSCPNWSDDNVRSLTNRTITAAEIAIRKGLHPIVVIHPNTLNKKWHDLSLIYSELRKHKIEVALPWHRVSSYEYLNGSRLIATWRSTIGLEAILRSKQVVLLSDTVYDNLINFKSINDIDDLNVIIEKEREENSKFARLAIYYYTNFGYDLFSRLSDHEISKIQNYENLLPLGGTGKSIRNKFRKFLGPLRIFGATPREVFDFLSFFIPQSRVDWVMKYLINRYRY